MGRKCRGMVPLTSKEEREQASESKRERERDDREAGPPRCIDLVGPDS